MSLDPGRRPHQHQLGAGRLHLHQDDPGRPEGGAGQGSRQIPIGRLGERTRWSRVEFLGRPGLGVHHRPDLLSQQRPGHITIVTGLIRLAITHRESAESQRYCDTVVRRGGRMAGHQVR